MRVELSPRARGELFRALEFFALERRDLAVDFLADFEHAVSLLADFPHAGAISDPPVRKLRLRRFRYEVFYRVYGEVVQVAGLVHMSRGPAYRRNHDEEPAMVYGPILHGTRLLLHNFPYLAHYQVDSEQQTIDIVAVTHQRQKPSRWRYRVDEAAAATR